MFSWLFGSNSPPQDIARDELDSFTVAVAESVTAGALANSLCTEPKSSRFFKGGVTVYSIASKHDVLGINTKFAEANNYANPFTTGEMARAVADRFKSRIGLATTGYSSPCTREENTALGQCALDIKIPYVYICLYDSHNGYERIVKITYADELKLDLKMMRVTVQVKAALEAKKMYNEYVRGRTALPL